MAVADQLAQIIAQQARIVVEQERTVANQDVLVTGTADDPASFNSEGGKTGQLGYYPVFDASGITRFMPCTERLMVSNGSGLIDELLTLVERTDSLADFADLQETVFAAESELANGAARSAALEARTDGIGGGDVITQALLGAVMERIGLPVLTEAGGLVSGYDENLRLLAVAGLRLLDGRTLKVGEHHVGAVSSDFPVHLTDADGYPLIAMDRTLRWMMRHLHVDGELAIGASALSSAPASSPWSVTDVDGYSYIAVVDGDIALMHAGSSADLAMLYADARNRARSASIMGSPHNLAIARLDALRALILLYSQSLGNGQEAHPAVTMAPLSPSAFMVGPSVRPGWFYGPGWFPQDGDATLHPLKATVELGINDASPTQHTRRPLNGAQIAALDPHDAAEGESPIVAIANRVALQWDDAGYRPARKIVAMACGVGGRTLEELSKNSTTAPFDFYKRVIDAITLHASLAAAAGETANVAMISMIQGEANYASDTAAHDVAGYKALIVQLYRDIAADARAVTGQLLPPAMVTYITSGSYMDDADHAAISMAQVQAGLEVPGIFCMGPSYPVADKGGHLDGDGSRHLGEMMAKVTARVLVDRLGWEPLYPLKVERIGRAIYVHHHVPCGPLRIAPLFDGVASRLYDDAGYRVTDAGGDVSIERVSIIGSTITKILCAREPGDTAEVLYADKTLHNGGGNICDSDPARSNAISTRTNQPYDLSNWCGPYRLPVGWSRS